MLYSRPVASDFDDWEKEYSNVGWGAKDMIPLLEKVPLLSILPLLLTYSQAETYEIELGKPTHGSSGPLKVSHGGISLPIGKEFIDIGSKLEKDRPASDEGNAFDKESINVFYVSFLTPDNYPSSLFILYQAYAQVS